MEEGVLLYYKYFSLFEILAETIDKKSVMKNEKHLDWPVDSGEGGGGRRGAPWQSQIPGSDVPKLSIFGLCLIFPLSSPWNPAADCLLHLCDTT